MRGKRARRRKVIADRIAQLESKVRHLRARVLELENMLPVAAVDHIAVGLSISRKIDATEYSLVPSNRGNDLMVSEAPPIAGRR